MKDNLVQAGFVGVGNFVTAHHLPNVTANPAIHIRAMCDLDEAVLRDRAERFPSDYMTTDYTEVLGDPDIDLVIVGTRHDLHAALSIEAMRAGKDVLCEKPMAISTDEIADVVKAERETGRRYLVGHNRRFAPSMLEAKRILSGRERPFMALYRIVDNAELWPDWPMDKDKGGKLLSECSHVFDVLAWVLDAEPTSVYAIGRPEDNNVVNLTFSDGSIASVVSGGLGSEAYPKELLEVFCRGATVAVDHFLQLKVSGIDGEKDLFFPFSKDPWSHVSDRQDSDGFRARMNVWRKNISPEDYARRYYANLPVVDKGHYGEVDALAQAIRHDAPSPSNAVDAARATVCSLKAVESLSTRRPVPIGEADYFADDIVRA